MSDSYMQTIRKHMKVFQNPLPLVEEPFAVYAGQLGISQRETLDLLRHYLSDGIIKRIAGIIKHRHAGFVFNAMVAIAVEPECCNKAGEALARFPFITHCYRRTSYADWPYTIYAMVHARSATELDECIAKIRVAVKSEDMIVLRSTREFKKTAFRMQEKI